MIRRLRDGTIEGTGFGCRIVAAMYEAAPEAMNIYVTWMGIHPALLPRKIKGIWWRRGVVAKALQITPFVATIMKNCRLGSIYGSNRRSEFLAKAIGYFLRHHHRKQIAAPNPGRVPVRGRKSKELFLKSVRGEKWQ